MLKKALIIVGIKNKANGIDIYIEEKALSKNLDEKTKESQLFTGGKKNVATGYK